MTSNADKRDHRPPIAYLAPELGAVTSTFVYREIFALRRLGLSVVPFATRRPATAVLSEEAGDLARETLCVYDSSLLAVLKSVLAISSKHPVRFMLAFGTLLRDMALARQPRFRDHFAMAWQFLMGCVMAAHAAKLGVAHVHAHFAHVPATVAMYAAMVMGRPFSFTAHANDLFERPAALLEKARRAAFVVCISGFNRCFLQTEGCDMSHVHVIHCGLDIDKHPFAPPVRLAGPPRLLTVGRFVEKKGFAILVEALALIRTQGRAFSCRMVGDGPLFNTIKAQIQQAGLADCVELLGSLPQEEVRELFGHVDIFVLPCVQSATGDQDGIPVVLMEAMATGVPVVSTTLSGIPELVRHEKNGLLAAPSDAKGLAACLARLIDDPEYAVSLTANARETIEREFDINASAALLAAEFTRRM